MGSSRSVRTFFSFHPFRSGCAPSNIFRNTYFSQLIDDDDDFKFSNSLSQFYVKIRTLLASLAQRFYLYMSKIVLFHTLIIIELLLQNFREQKKQ